MDEPPREMQQYESWHTMLHNYKVDAGHAKRPAFLITIDAEGDNLWAKPHTITTENARYLLRFQAVCEDFGLRPTYLANWEMANCPIFCALGHDLLARNVGEIGMHLHAWNSPPLIPLTADDYVHQPYLTEYPEDPLRQKIQVLTECLEQTFQTKMISHRAGRWGFNEVYAKALIDQGYRADCTVTPHLSWRQYAGAPNGTGGPDFTNYPETAYFLDPDDISRPGQSSLLEVPLTVTAPYFGHLADALQPIFQIAGPPGKLAARHFFPPHARMIPNGRNRRLLLALLSAAVYHQRDYVQLTLHSSELMPGASPTFPSPRSIEQLYDDLTAVFTFARDHFVGMTLREYHDRLAASPASDLSVVGVS